MPIDISDKEQLNVPLTGTQMNDAIVQAHKSKDAIANIEDKGFDSLESSASEIDNTVLMVGNVKNYGNIGNGENATLAFQACALANPKGGKIFIPSGSYVAENIPLDTGSPDYIPYYWIGSGSESTTITLPTTPNYDMFTTSTPNHVMGGCVKDLKLVGDSVDASIRNGTKHGINFESTPELHRFELSGCVIDKFDNGMRGGQRDRSPIIERNFFTANQVGYYCIDEHPLFRSCNDFRGNTIGIGGIRIFDCTFVGQKMLRNKYNVYPSNGVYNSQFVGCIMGLSEKGIKVYQNVSFVSGYILLQQEVDTHDPVSLFEVELGDLNISGNSIFSFGDSPSEGVVCLTGTDVRRVSVKNNTIYGNCGRIVSVLSPSVMRECDISMNTYRLYKPDNALVHAPDSSFHIDNTVFGNKFYSPANMDGTTVIKLASSNGRNFVSNNTIVSELNSNITAFIDVELGNGGRARDNISRQGGDILISGVNASTNPDNTYLP